MIATDLVLSPSRIKAYLQCGRCFELAYIEHQQEPRRSIALPIGSAVHGAAAEARRQKMFQLWDVQSALGAAEAAFNASLSGESEPGYGDGAPPIEWDLGKYSDLGAPLDDAMKLAKMVIAQVVAQEDVPLAVESELDYSEVFPFQFRGTVDVRLPLGEQEEIRDLKTAARGGVPDDYVALQMALYGLPDWAEGREVMLGVDVVTKTKTPALERYEFTPTSAEYSTVCSLVVGVAEHIAAGDFPVRPQVPFRCRWDHGLPRFSLPVSWPEVA